MITRVALLFCCVFVASCNRGGRDSDIVAADSLARHLDKVPLEGDSSSLATGAKVFEEKCQLCHRLDGQRDIGPGLAGVTVRRSPEWILNMILNTGEMLEKDSVAARLLEIHLTRMPQQEVTKAQALNIVRFLQSNDSTALAAGN